MTNPTEELHLARTARPPCPMYPACGLWWCSRRSPRLHCVQRALAKAKRRLLDPVRAESQPPSGPAHHPLSSVLSPSVRCPTGSYDHLCGGEPSLPPVRDLFRPISHTANVTLGSPTARHGATRRPGSPPRSAREPVRLGKTVAHGLIVVCWRLCVCVAHGPEGRRALTRVLRGLHASFSPRRVL